MQSGDNFFQGWLEGRWRKTVMRAELLSLDWNVSAQWASLMITGGRMSHWKYGVIFHIQWNPSYPSCCLGFRSPMLSGRTSGGRRQIVRPRNHKSKVVEYTMLPVMLLRHSNINLLTLTPWLRFISVHCSFLIKTSTLIFKKNKSHALSILLAICPYV